MLHTVGFRYAFGSLFRLSVDHCLVALVSCNLEVYPVLEEKVECIRMYYHFSTLVHTDTCKSAEFNFAALLCFTLQRPGREIP